MSPKAEDQRVCGIQSEMYPLCGIHKVDLVGCAAVHGVVGVRAGEGVQRGDAL